jgi:hypothetical protein
MLARRWRMATNVEERLRELEAEVIAARAKNAPAPASKPPVAPAPVVAMPAKASMAPVDAPKKGFLRSWKSKALVVGGVILAGAIALWVVGKLVKLALYVGIAAAVVGFFWWLTRKKKAK